MAIAKPSVSIAALESILERLMADCQALGLSAPPAGGGSTPAPEVPTAAAPVASPSSTFPGAGTPEVEAVIAQAAASCGFYPATLEAEERWETGNYADPHAGAWWKGNNPGGMKFSRGLVVALGAMDTPYVATDGVTEYFRWSTWQRGILGHGLFMARSNYDGARAAGLDVAGQVRAVYDAGYCPSTPEWLTNVTLIAQRLASQHVVASIPHVTSPVQTHTATAIAVTTAAKLFVGHPLSASDPLFTYAPDTEAGNLGCADSVSSILVAAKVLQQVILLVANVTLALIGLGWIKISPASIPQDGDVVVWVAWAASGWHQHIGIVYFLNGVAHVVANSSSKLHIVDVPLAGYDNDRPVAYYLRAPGA